MATTQTRTVSSPARGAGGSVMPKAPSKSTSHIWIRARTIASLPVKYANHEPERCSELLRRQRNRNHGGRGTVKPAHVGHHAVDVGLHAVERDLGSSGQHERFVDRRQANDQGGRIGCLDGHDVHFIGEQDGEGWLELASLLRDLIVGGYNCSRLASQSSTARRASSASSPST